MATRLRVGGRWFSWLLGGAMLGAVIIAAVHYSDPRELYRLGSDARPGWLLVALLLQSGTYLVQGEIWRIVIRAAGAFLPTGTAYSLSVAKLSVDQILPSAGISGDVLMVKALERRGVARSVVMAGVVVDTASCYGSYVLGLGVALVINVIHHQASELVLVTSVPFAIGGIGVTVAVLVLSGRRAGAVAQRVARIGPLSRALTLFAEADRGLALRPEVLLRSSACQVAILLLDAATIWVLVQALGATADPSGVFAGFMISTLFRIVGVLPGGLGAFEAASVLTLKSIGVGLPVALAATLLFRGLSFWLPMLPGLWLARRAVRRTADHGSEKEHRRAGSGSEKPERLSPEDSARWSMATPENPMVIGALLLFEQRLSLEALEEVVRSKLAPHRRLRQHVVEPAHRFGRPCWRDDLAFEIREHVRKLSPAEIAPLALAALVGERMSAPLPGDRSPWALEVVDLTAGGSALIARFQHCLADGRALVSLLGEIGDGLGTRPQRAAAPPPPSRVVRAGGFFDGIARLYRLVTMSADPAGPLRRPLSGQKRVAWSASIPLESVKAIARERNQHVADVLLAGVAGALRRYETEHGEAPRPIRALLPVATPGRSSSDGVGNHYASVFVSLPVATSDSGARLEMIGRDSAARRNGRELRTAIGLTRLAGAMAPALERWAVRWGARRASLVVSNLPGPPAPVRLAQRAVESIVVWAPAAASIGLSFTLFGYAGTLQLGVLADSSVIERPEELVAGFRAALDELRGGAPPSSP